MGEEKKLIFVDDTESFIIKSIMKNLEARHHPCEMIHLDIKEIDRVKDNIEGYLFMNVPDKGTVDVMAFTYLRDVCFENDAMIYFFGYEDDIDSIRDGLVSDRMCDMFLRPINAQQVTEDIEDLLSDMTMALRRKHILVVDDSGTMLTTIKSWLENKYRVSVVNSAMNAITFLATQRPDLILLDYEMPVCSGAQFLEMLRADAHNADIPVIFLTGKDDADSVRNVLALKPAGYLLKSRPKEEIIGEVDKFFSVHREQ